MARLMGLRFAAPPEFTPLHISFSYQASPSPSLFSPAKGLTLPALADLQGFETLRTGELGAWCQGVGRFLDAGRGSKPPNLPLPGGKRNLPPGSAQLQSCVHLGTSMWGSRIREAGLEGGGVNSTKYLRNQLRSSCLDGEMDQLNSRALIIHLSMWTQFWNKVTFSPHIA